MNGDEIRKVLIEVLDERARVTPELHGQHHEWIAAQIARENSRREMYEKVTAAVAGWTVTSLLGYLVYVMTQGHWPRNGG